MAPGIHVKDLFNFYKKATEQETEKVSRLIQDGKHKEARRIMDEVMARK